MNSIHISPLNGEFIAEELIKRSKDINIIYLTEDVILDTNGVKELSNYISKLQKENEEFRKYSIDMRKAQFKYVYKDNKVKILADGFVSKEEYEKLQKELEQEKSRKQLEIDTAEEVLKWKGKYHLLSRKINVVSKDKIKDKMNYLEKNIELQWASTNYNEIDVEKYQYALEILEDLLKED